MKGWKTYKFSEAIDIAPKVTLEKGQDYPFVEMAELNSERKFCEAAEQRPFDGGGTKFRNGDTLFARITPCLENGKICQVRNLATGKGFGSTEFHVLRGKEGVTDTDFVYYLSRWYEVRDFAEANLHGTSGRQRVPREAFNTLEVSLPPLAEQRAIAAVLSSLDDKIDLLHRQNKTLFRLGQTILKKILIKHETKEDKKRCSEGWSTQRLGDVADVSWGDTNTTKESYTTSGYDAYSASGLDGKMNHFDYDQPGIVLGAIGANCGETWLAFGRWSCIKNTIRILARPGKVGIEYLYLYTYGKDFWPKRGSAQPFISQTDARNCEILVPEESTLTDFTGISKDLLPKINNNIKTIALLSHTRDSLLPKLMSGEVPV